MAEGKVDCPYCNYENVIVDIEEDEIDVECYECEKEFRVSVDWEPILYSSKIIIEKCPVCGEFKELALCAPRPKKAKHKKECRECYIKMVSEEMKEETGNEKS